MTLNEKKMEQFKVFVDGLMLLGYGQVDLELMLWHCILNENDKGIETLRRLGWNTEIHDELVTDGEIYRRYQHVRFAPWAEKRLKDTEWIRERLSELAKEGISFQKFHGIRKHFSLSDLQAKGIYSDKR